ncbi:alkyl sulfatase dimerization domain-containing protein [Vibrio sp. YMD68]|uniref:alkyl/aryl-sulfatase n=1 Tax=Vibrio sp. YMD68 TaxID=3042300 RepID=UPI00249B672C|nr:alkyl sulfatase dimerization domain-containing protein [Vibrio sp. YMD68]WGV99224.1 alkyl sulfatase dimerization domain-containing protein [Vibrio sp. YMD68]
MKLSTLSVLITAVVSGSVIASASLPTFTPDQKEATPHTIEFQKEIRTTLPFADQEDWDLAKKGFIARVDDLEIKDANGSVVWELGNYDYLLQGEDYDTIHPSMQRQAELNMEHGLFEIMPGKVYQVRGYDLAQVSFVRSDNGWVVFDPLTIPETAAAAYDLFKAHVKEARELPITAVVYSHSHGDHFGGVKGLVSQEQVDSGDVQIIAPRAFSDFAISENVLAGNVMARRVVYQYGNTLEKSAKGQVDAAIGKGVANGGLSLILPTHQVEDDLETLTIDGLEMVFHNAPDTEAPSEMNTYIPEYKAYWGAETTVAGLHNVYTLRGAFVRDTMQWADSINEALYMFGGEAELLFASHGWPRFGNENIQDYLRGQRDMYGYLHDETLRLINHGVSITDIQDEFFVPKPLADQWYTRGYHGSYHRNAKAVANKYIGYFDMNPATLLHLNSVDQATKYTEMMGEEAILAEGKKAFESGEFRWCATVVNNVVFANPENMQARYLQADCFEQLGYQSESSGERNVFLAGASELRNGIVEVQSTKAVTPDLIQAMPTRDFLNFMGVRFNGPQAAMDGFVMNANLVIPDEDAKYAIEASNGRVSNIEGFDVPNPDFTLTINRSDITLMLLQQTTLQELLKDGKATVKGDLSKVGQLTGYLDDFKFWFKMALPQDHSEYSFGKSKTGVSPVNR